MWACATGSSIMCQHCCFCSTLTQGVETAWLILSSSPAHIQSTEESAPSAGKVVLSDAGPHSLHYIVSGSPLILGTRCSARQRTMVTHSCGLLRSLDVGGPRHVSKLLPLDMTRRLLQSSPLTPGGAFNRIGAINPTSSLLCPCPCHNVVRRQMMPTWTSCNSRSNHQVNGDMLHRQYRAQSSAK
jgi:hypothetical protein